MVRNPSSVSFYMVLHEGKEKYYQKKNTYRVTESCLEIKLQDVLDHTKKCLNLRKTVRNF